VGGEVVATAKGRVHVWAPVGAPSGQLSRAGSALVWCGCLHHDEAKGAPNEWGVRWLPRRRGAFTCGRRLVHPGDNPAVWARCWSGVGVCARRG
jgi:hypothetical protein